MTKPHLNRRGNSVVVVTIAGAVAVTALVGVAQLAANYSQQQSKARKASGLLTKKEMALEFLRSKFTPREMANGSVGTEWSIRNVSNQVEVSAQNNYCYEFNSTTRVCSAKSDPLKAPIRDVYRRWQMIDGKDLCATVTPYQEYSGAADPQTLCAPHFDEYEKDGSRLASVQTKATLQGNEQQKAYITVSDLAILSSSEQVQLLSSSPQSQLVQKSLVPVRVTFSSYVQKNAPDPDEITVVFDDGDQGQVLIPKASSSCTSFSVKWSETQHGFCDYRAQATGVAGGIKIVGAKTAFTSPDLTGSFPCSPWDENNGSLKYKGAIIGSSGIESACPTVTLNCNPLSVQIASGSNNPGLTVSVSEQGITFNSVLYRQWLWVEAMSNASSGVRSAQVGTHLDSFSYAGFSGVAVFVSSAGNYLGGGESKKADNTVRNFPVSPLKGNVVLKWSGNGPGPGLGAFIMYCRNTDANNNQLSGGPWTGLGSSSFADYYQVLK